MQGRGPVKSWFGVLVAGEWNAVDNARWDGLVLYELRQCQTIGLIV